MGCFLIADVIISSTVNKFGAAATKGISIANQFDGVLYQIINSPSLATVSYISQNVAAKNILRVKNTMLCSVFITVAFGASFGALSAIFSPELSYIMSHDPKVIAYSCQKMMLISSTYFICGINNVYVKKYKRINKVLR